MSAPSRTKSVKTKPAGVISLRVDAEFLNMLDDWRRTKSPIPSRSAAIKYLVERGVRKGKT
jgi:hypothetical protein